MSDIISKDKLLEPFNIINEFELKEIQNFDKYYDTIVKKTEELEQLEFNSEYIKLIDYAKALSNDIRIKILYFIQKVGKTCFCELETIFNIKQSTLNYHLRLLKRAKFVTTYKEGKLIVIQLSENFHDLIPEQFQIFND